MTAKKPGKLCGLIADAVLDECLMEDENARVAYEVMCMNVKISPPVGASSMPYSGWLA